MKQWIVFLLIGNLTLAWAHNVTYAELQGVKLCIEPRSVQVLVDVPDLPETLVQGIKTRLEHSLPTILTNHQVPFAQKERCAANDGFILTDFYITLLDDGISEPAYTVTIATNVGKAPTAPNASLDPNIVLDNPTFNHFSSGLLLPPDLAEPFHQELPAINEDGFKDLALAWWEDNPNGLLEVSYLPHVIGIVLGVIIVGIGFTFLSRRKGRQREQLS